jgi:hypothetical protein
VVAVNWAELGPVFTVEGMVVVVDEESGIAVTSWVRESPTMSAKNHIVFLLEMTAQYYEFYSGVSEDL